jgi:DNA-binding SARP family transcriptional activator
MTTGFNELSSRNSSGSIGLTRVHEPVSAQRCGVIRASGQPVVDSTRSEIWLGVEVQVDVREQIAIARRLLDPTLEPPRQDYGTLLEGELLLGWHDDWVLFERERLRQLRLHALEALARKLNAVGRRGVAVDACFAALRADPLHESTHRLLIETYLSEGNRSEAIRHYRSYRNRLQRSLGLDPSRELQALMREVGTTYDPRVTTTLGRLKSPSTSRRVPGT